MKNILISELHGHLSPIKSHVSATQITGKTQTPSKITLTKDWCSKSTCLSYIRIPPVQHAADYKACRKQEVKVVQI